jgi:Ca-activated chloride channel family protein
VKAAVVEAKPLPEPPPAAAVPAASSESKRVRIPGPGTLQLQPAPWVKMPPYYWELVDAETGEARGRNNLIETRIKAGEYQVVWRQTEHGGTPVPLTATVRVESGETALAPLDTGLRISLPDGISPPYYWSLVQPGGAQLLRVSGNLDPQLVPAGEFRLLWRQTEHGSGTVDMGRVQVQPGRLNELVLDQGIQLQPADWLGKPTPYFYELRNERGEQVGRWSGMGPQLAPAGTYDLIYRPSEHGHSNIRWGQVRIPDQGMVGIPLNSGIQFIHKGDAKPPYGIFLVNLDTKEEIALRNNWDPLPVPPGRYRLDWWATEHGSRRETLADELKVEAGTLLELEL